MLVYIGQRGRKENVREGKKGQNGTWVTVSWIYKRNNNYSKHLT